MTSSCSCGTDVEVKRLAALADCDLLDTPREAEFDTAVAIACRLFNCPISTVSLVDDHRQWFKARVGLDNDGCAREQSLCAVAMHEPEILVVEDLRLDRRFADNPIVTHGPQVRFYAGVSLCPDDPLLPGIGTLCIMDTRPRTFSKEDARLLRDLAGMVCAIIRARKSAAATLRLSETVRRSADVINLQNAQLRQAERMVGVGSWRLDLRDQSLVWSDHVYAIHDLPVGAMPGYDVALSFYPPPDRARITQSLNDATSRGIAFDHESDFITAAGRRRRVRSMGEPQIVDGKVVALTGVFQDVTERYEREQRLRKSASTDALTGLPNRRAFEKKLADAFARARRKDEPLALMLLDLDGFKAVNDTLGHEAGDEVLREVARRLRTGGLEHLFAARLGGDEFVLLATRPRDCVDVARLVEIALGEVRHTVQRADRRLTVSTTIGAIHLEPGIEEPADLLRRADVALYEAKRHGRGTGRLSGAAAPIRAHGGRPRLVWVA